MEEGGIFVESLFLIGIILVLGIANFIAFKISGKIKKRRIWVGVVIILITPIVFFVTMAIISQFDSGGFGMGLFSVLNTFLFFVNGIVIIIIGLFTNRTKEDI